MAIYPSSIKPLKAEVLDVKGECSAGHRKGDTFSIGCYDSGGLCGFFYHEIFANLSVMQWEHYRLVKEKSNSDLSNLKPPI